MKRILLSSCLLFALQLLRADVALCPLFQDHLVLQREKPVPVWGTAEPGESVTVAFGAQEKKIKADAAGRWSVELAPLPASAEPATLSVSGKNRIEVEDVLVGEVWLCSGQSNMEFMLARALEAKAELAAAKFPLVRHFKVEHNLDPKASVAPKGAWRQASPETVGDFSAVAYYFGKNLQEALRVPVGLINSSWGGTPAEAWTPLEVLKADKLSEPLLARWDRIVAEYPAKNEDYQKRLARWETARDRAKAEKREFRQKKPTPPVGPGHQRAPGILYQGMIQPLVPFAVRGAIWYQAEGNATAADEYKHLFATMIGAWRERLGQGDFPFYWVQLPNFKNPADPTGMNWATLREAQTAALSLPATGQVVTLDVGNPDDIHPTNKRPVGERLARLALARTYGLGKEPAGPRMLGAHFGSGSVRLDVDPGLGGRLVAAGENLLGFEVAGDDRSFQPAKARVEQDGSVIVASDKVAAPVAVRYAWRNNPENTLRNSEGLPAAPYRSDNW